MTDSKPIYRFLPKKRIELPSPPTPAPTSTPPTEQPPTQSEQPEIRLERIDSSVPATQSLGNSGWEVAHFLKEWRLDQFT